MSTQVGHVYTLPSRILLATDLQGLNQMLPVAMAYAVTCDAALKLLNVQPIHADRDTERQPAQESLEQAAQQGRDARLACTWVLRRGPVAETIVQVVQEWKADRLVIGSHDFQDPHRELLGAVTGAIFREVEIPILSISPACRHPIHGNAKKKSRILLASALNRESFVVTQSIARFVREHQAEITMLHVMPEIAKAHPSAVRVRSYAESKFQQILSGITGASKFVSCMIETGQVVETILRVAAQGHFDMILLTGVYGSSFRPEIMPGIAYRIICRAPCPVLVIKEQVSSSSNRLPAA